MDWGIGSVLASVGTGTLDDRCGRISAARTPDNYSAFETIFGEEIIYGQIRQIIVQRQYIFPEFGCR